MVVNMEIEMVTPPVDLNLFDVSGIAGMPVLRVVRATLPFLCILFLILVTYIPWLSTFLPIKLMRAPKSSQANNSSPVQPS